MWLDQREEEVHRGHLAQQVFLDQLEELAHLAQRALLVSQVHLVSQVKKVHVVFEEIMDLPDVMEREVNLVLLEALETKEILEKMAHRGLMVHQDLLEQQGREVL